MISRYSQLSEPEDAVSKVLVERAVGWSFIPMSASQARRGILFLEAIAVQARRMHMQQDMLNEFLENKIESWCHDEASRLKFVWAESMQDLAKVPRS